MSTISDILFSLTSKQSWYSEVFDDSIVEKWREETYRTLPLITPYSLRLAE